GEPGAWSVARPGISDRSRRICQDRRTSSRRSLLRPRPFQGRRSCPTPPVRGVVKLSRNDAQYLAVFGCERNAPVRRVQRTIRALHEPVREAREPVQQYRPLASLAIESDEVGAVGRPLIVVGEDLNAIELVAVPGQANDRVAGPER